MVPAVAPATSTTAMKRMVLKSTTQDLVARKSRRMPQVVGKLVNVHVLKRLFAECNTKDVSLIKTNYKQANRKDQPQNHDGGYRHLPRRPSDLH